MKESLEDFIRQNRSAFDDKEPPEGAWENINAAIMVPKNPWNSLMLWRAAAVIFMALSFYLYMSDSGQPVNQSSTGIASADFNDVEQFYFQQISEKVEMIDDFKKSEGLNGFTQDFKQLEAMYTVLKEEMKTTPSEKVKDALVLNLLIRIDLLNQQLHSLEKEYKRDEAANKGSV